MHEVYPQWLQLPMQMFLISCRSSFYLHSSLPSRNHRLPTGYSPRLAPCSLSYIYLYLATSFFTASTYLFWASAALRSLCSCHLLYLALPCGKKEASAVRRRDISSRNCKTYLEVDHAGLGGVLELGGLRTLLEQSVDLHDALCGQRWSSSTRTCTSSFLTSRSSSLEGVWVRERLSSWAFLNSGDWATMLAVTGVFCFGFVGGCVFGWDGVARRRNRNRKVGCPT